MDEKDMADPAKAASAAERTTPLHQQEVDALQAAVRAGLPGRSGLFRPPPPKPEPSARLLDHRLAEEMANMSRQLDQLAGILAGDPVLLMRHAGPLQSIDLMKQTLDQLARVVAAENKEAVAATITLTELNGRLHRKAVRPIAEDGGKEAPAP